MKETNRVQSVIRALDILEVFPVQGPELGLTAIANNLKINKATAHRLLSTLESRGFIERSFDQKKYRLGYRSFELGAFYQNQLDVRRIAVQHMIKMVEETGEASFLCIREADEALCIERVESKREVNIFTLRVGGRQPLHCGAAPRSLMAGLLDAEVEEYAHRTGLPALTDRTITTLEDLRCDIELTRQQGYVVSYEDVTLGIAAVGAPILNHNGKVIAAISLSGLASMFHQAHIQDLALVIRKNAKQLSWRLGYRE